MMRVLVMTLSLVLCLPVFAAACDFPFVAIPELYSQASAVFVGRVLESPWAEKAGAVDVTGEPQVVFEIQKTYKGTLPRKITMSRMNGCSYPFLRGETYLVHAVTIDGALETHQGLRPLPMAKATEALKYVEGALVGMTPAVLIVGTDGERRPEVLTLILQGPNGKLERTIRPEQNELPLPAGEYTAWLELAGKVISQRQDVRLQQGKVTRSSFRIRR